MPHLNVMAKMAKYLQINARRLWLYHRGVKCGWRGWLACRDINGLCHQWLSGLGWLWLPAGYEKHYL